MLENPAKYITKVLPIFRYLLKCHILCCNFCHIFWLFPLYYINRSVYFRPALCLAESDLLYSSVDRKKKENITFPGCYVTVDLQGASFSNSLPFSQLLYFNHINSFSIQTNITCDGRDDHTKYTAHFQLIKAVKGSICCYQQLFMFLVPRSPGNKELLHLRGRDINHTLTWRFWRKTRIILSDKVTLKVTFIHQPAACTSFNASITNLFLTQIEIMEIRVQFHFAWTVQPLPDIIFPRVGHSVPFLLFNSYSQIKALTLQLIIYSGNITRWLTQGNGWLILLNCAAYLCCRVCSVYILWYPVITTSGFICLGAQLETEQT